VKYLGEEGDNTHIAGAAAICSPWDLLVCDRFISRRLVQRFYGRAITIGLQIYARTHKSIYSRLVDWEGIQKDLVVWLNGRLQALEDRSGEIGFVRRERIKDLAILVYARENKDGRFLSIPFVSKHLPGKVTICVPAVDEFSGWVAFRANIQALCGAEGRRRRTTRLKDSVLTLINWYMIMVEFENEKEVERVLKVPSVKLPGIRVGRVARCTIVVTQSLQKDLFWFGSLVKIDEQGGEYKEVSRVRIQVEGCYLLKIPNILPLMEDRVTYLIRMGESRRITALLMWLMIRRQLIGLEMCHVSDKI
ncbi:alpha/beta-Hydrolases superfamily protein, partial [Thalictrum thalictroides]